jgi:hypothetical protein
MYGNILDLITQSFVAKLVQQVIQILTMLCAEPAGDPKPGGDLMGFVEADEGGNQMMKALLRCDTGKETDR